jgi:hypothetical protein
MGERVWSVPPPNPTVDAWVSAELNSTGQVEASSWSGYRVTIDASSGVEIRRSFTK